MDYIEVLLKEFGNIHELKNDEENGDDGDQSIRKDEIFEVHKL